MINPSSLRGRHWLAIPFVLLACAVSHAETPVSGTLAPGSLQILAPASYVPGVPFLVRVDSKDAAGALNRSAWNGTATLAGSNGVTVTPSTVPLVNGMGSALVTVGGSAAGPPVHYLTYGTGGTGGAIGTTTGTPGSMWRHRTNLTSATVASIPTTWKDAGFDDSAWPEGPGQIGYGDTNPADENFRLAVTDYNGATAGTPVPPAYLFRTTFNIADISQITSVTGEVKYDDAAIVYINGTEVLRTAGFDTPANVPQVPLTVYSNFGGADTTENATAAINVPLNLVHNGVNTIAVQIHQHDNGSSDLTFDCRLQGNTGSSISDPGNFTLTATSGPLGAGKALTSLGAAAGTTVSGALPAGTTNWSGVVRVTGDVTVPAGATLNIAAGTHILMTGTTGAGSTSGSDIIVNSTGTIHATGTAAEPISITSSEPAARWGEINVAGSTTSWSFCLISHGGHSPGGGHTGTGPCFRLTNGAVWTFDDGVVADVPGKTLTNSGNTTMTMRRSQFARCVMGPETDGSGITIEDCNFTDMLPAFRESGSADDEDNIYIHNSGGRPVNLRRSVFGNAGDDGIDCLGGSLTVEDCIIRNIFDKGVSLLQNNITIRRTQIVDCDFCISTKTQIDDEDTTYTTTLENCTIVGEAHPTNQSDQSGGVYWHNVGVHVRNKYGTGPNAQLPIIAKNCIISAVTPMLNDYAVAGNDHPLATVSYNCYQDVAGTNPVDPAPPSGTGTIVANPLFVNAAGKDFHLAAGSPAINTGDPAMTDPDNSRIDMGALPFTANSGSSTVTWNLAGSPYHMTANTTVPAGVTLVIEPGVSVYGDQNARLTVNGRILAAGTAASHITFSGVPGAVATGDADPIKNGTQTGPPKWGGVRVVDSLTQENIFRYCDFTNAQGTDPTNSENWGSLGFIRSWGWADHLTFAGTHLRMCYGRNCKLMVTHCDFPDMFKFDAVLNRVEIPTQDFLASADNRMEPLKVEFPTTDPELAGQTGDEGAFPNGLPRDGYWRVYYNDFHGNRGHQDVFDADSGRWGQPGQFMLDCRFNTFHGLTGDEHIDLGGDAFIAFNKMYSGSKDQWTVDTGYANAISSGDKGSGTTIVVAGNIFYDLDHAINCKINTATIFEHNTCVDFHQDWAFDHTVQQDVRCAAVNLYVPNDGNAAGDGCYIAYNIFYGNSVAPDDTVNPDPVGGFPRLVSWPDVTTTGPKTSIIRIENNFVDNRILDTGLGANHPGGIFAPAWGSGNIQGDPMFTDKAAKDFSLKAASPAKGAAPGGLDFGATVGQWAYVVGGPTGTVTATTASFTIGGPGIVAYKWRLDGGAWSAPIQIGDGGLLPRTGPIVRQATLNLNNLSAGSHTLEVLGQDMAANWQDNDPARTVEGLPQATATTRTWTVNSGQPGLNTWLSDHGLTPADLTLDGDGDGLTNLVEYALATNPSSSAGTQGAGALPVAQTSTIAGNAVPAMLASIPASAQPGGFGLLDVTYIFQDSADLNTWRDVLRKSPADNGWQNISGSPATLVEVQGTAGGYTTFVLKSPDSISSTIHKYLRLRIVQTP